MDAIISIVEYTGGALICGLLLYMAYKTGHQRGFDDGVREEDIRGFYHQPGADSAQVKCATHNCPDRAACDCYSAEPL